MLAEIIPKIAGMENERDYPYSPRPSSAGPERCIRQMVYHGLKIPRSPMPGRARLILDDSSWHEELTADWLRKSPFKIHSQQMKISVTDPVTGITLTGSIDGIITDLLKIDRMFEHKAINHFTFQRFWGGEVPLDYVTQPCLYIKGIQKDNPDIAEAILLIKNKNTAQYMEYLICYNATTDIALIDHRINSQGERINMGMAIPDITASAFTRFLFVDEYIKTKTLPKRQYDVDHWRCEYCGWFKACWGEYRKEFEELKTDAMLPEEIETMVKYYKELGAQKSDIEKEYKGISEKIKGVMTNGDIREGIAGDYLCRLKLIETERIDKSLLTEAEKEKAIKKGMSVRLYISRPDKPDKKEEAA